VSRVLSFALFLLVMLAVLGGMHYYLWARLVRDPGLAEPWRRSLTVLIALGAAAVPAGMIAWRLSRHGLPRALPVATYAWLGLAFLLFCALLAAEAMRWAAAAGSFLWASLQRLPDPPADPVRRLFLARAAAGGAALVAGGSSAWAFHRATSDPEVREVPVRLERLPRALSGLTIAQITDLHVGPTIRDREVRRVVELTNALRPDIVAVTGDLVDGTVLELRRTISEMARLEARYGVFFVTGNHEYYLPGTGTEDWMAELSRLGMRVLRNERVRVGDTGPGGASIDLAGIDDWRTEPSAPGPERLARALAGRDPERSLVLLAHQPLGVSQAVRSGAELQLSGHTHGGQIFPFSLLVSAVYRYARGLHRLEEAGARGQIYVSRGTGYWGPPMRLGEPAEITKVVLTA
jgi:predicted MPP superfamily phosphohydrolase